MTEGIGPSHIDLYTPAQKSHIVFDVDEYNNLQSMVCPDPGCRGGYTHITGVRYWTREVEFSGEIKPIHISYQGEVFEEVREDPKSELAQGFSPERTSLALIFWCEDCQGEFYAVFAQHQGNTFTFTKKLGQKRWDDEED